MPETIKQLQRRIGELEREFHERHDSKVRKELERLSQEMARLKVEQAGDSKEKALVKEIRSKIIRKQYDEIDILGLLILLRRYSSAGSATYEFANFIAHRERTEGVVYEYLLDGTEQVNRALNNQPTRDSGPKFGSVFSSDDLKDSLNQAFSMIGIATVDDFETNDILLCIMCLLQDVRIVHRQNKRVIGVLALNYSDKHIQLYGTVPNIGKKKVTVGFPVLHVPNLQNDRLKEFEHTVAKSAPVRGRQQEEFSTLHNVISARCHNGHLTLFQGDPLAAAT
jgi:hypothetical protein